MAYQTNIRLSEKITVRVHKRVLEFVRPAKTSRDTLTSHEVWYILLLNEENKTAGIGECAPIWGLSAEQRGDFEEIMREIQQPHLSDNRLQEIIAGSSALKFAFETAERDLSNGGRRQVFNFDPASLLPINGLVWMNEKKAMLEEAFSKIKNGYSCIKLKIGGIRFEDELEILTAIRSEFPARDIELRLDANGAFSKGDALHRLDSLSRFDIHSIEQPIKAGQWTEMKELVTKSPIAIALDEDLIGITRRESREELIEIIRPHFLVLKPTLHGAFEGCDEWIELAEQNGVKWWATSALESNIGLNAIAQWLAGKSTVLPQGLGTGLLYANNIPSPLTVSKGKLSWNKELPWDVSSILPSDFLR